MCDVSKSPSDPTFAPLQPTSPSFETSALEGGPSDGVTVSLRDEALNFKTLSKEALAARDDRRLYAWLCPEEPTTDLTEFEHCVSTRSKTVVTVKSYLRSMKYWFASFHVEPADANAVDVFKKIYSSGLATTAMALSAKMMVGCTMLHIGCLTKQRNWMMAKRTAPRSAKAGRCGMVSSHECNKYTAPLQISRK